MDNNIINVTKESCNLYVSGVSDSNKYNSGYAYAIIDNYKRIGPVIDVYSRFYSDITNVKATLLAVIAGCKKAEIQGYNKITIKTSLEYISNMINEKWIPLWKKIIG